MKRMWREGNHANTYWGYFKMSIVFKQPAFYVLTKDGYSSV